MHLILALTCSALERPTVCPLCSLVVPCCRWVIGHFQRIALVDYMQAIGLALPPYKGGCVAAGCASNAGSRSVPLALLCPRCLPNTVTRSDVPCCNSLLVLRTVLHHAGYNASIDPSIDTFFTTVAYRYGHATINDVVLRLG